MLVIFYGQILCWFKLECKSTLAWPNKIFKLIESDVRYLDQMELKGKGFVSKHFPY